MIGFTDMIQLYKHLKKKITDFDYQLYVNI